MRFLSAVTIIVSVMASPVFASSVSGGDITLKNKGGNVVFSHSVHVDRMAQACTECHDKLYLSKGQHKKVSMKEMQKGKSCGACHNGKTAFTVKGNCSNCHKK